MRAAFALIALLLISLAGCSSSTGTKAEISAPASSRPNNVTAAFVPTVVHKTDTLHFLANPNLATSAPNSTQEIRVPLPDGIQDQDPTGLVASRPEWSFGLSQHQSVHAAQFTFWIDVTGTVVVRADNPGCTWVVGLFVTQSDGNSQATVACGTEAAGPLATGLHQITIGVELGDLGTWNAGDRVSFQPNTNAMYGPGGAIDIVTGTLEHDSIVKLSGLQMDV